MVKSKGRVTEMTVKSEKVFKWILCLIGKNRPFSLHIIIRSIQLTA